MARWAGNMSDSTGAKQCELYKGMECIQRKTHPLFQIVIGLVRHPGHDHQGSCNTNRERKEGDLCATEFNKDTLSDCDSTTRA